ncbi:hypothetical protein B566_EDAN002875 [Ephemera danica]|nr:hypothetical protein B566_EDAN002875 [Ephemera danica]
MSGDTKPTSYVIEISDVTTISFNGRMTAEFEVSRKTKEIVLHENGLSFIVPDSYTVQLLLPGGGTSSIGFGSAATKSDGTDQHVITVTDDLNPGSTYRLIIAYSGNIDDLQPDGFYNSPHGNAPNDRFLGLTQFATTSARRAFPCWDEPGMKATFQLTVEYPSTYTDVLSSKAAVGAPIDPLDPTLMRIEFPKSEKMSPHAMSWAVIEERDKKSEGKITVWTRRGFLPQAEAALQAAVSSVQHLESYLNSGPNTPRNVEKLDLIAASITEYPGLNNWGLQIYRETAILVEPSESSSFEHQRVWQLVAHEAVRQWFGDLVTPAWWNEIWLSEGLNSYFEYGTLGTTQKEWQMDEQFVVQQTQVALQADWYSGTYANIHNGEHANTHPLIFTNVATPGEIDSVFDTITYRKGESNSKNYDLI